MSVIYGQEVLKTLIGTPAMTTGQTPAVEEDHVIQLKTPAQLVVRKYKDTIDMVIILQLKLM